MINSLRRVMLCGAAAQLLACSSPSSTSEPVTVAPQGAPQTVTPAGALPRLPPHMRQSLAANLSRSGAKVAPVRPGLVVQSLSSSVPAVDAGLTVSTPTPPSNPPPNIPANYVLTGGGWEHPSCVHTVPNGSTVELDGTVTLDGKLVEKLTPCAYTQYPTTPGSAPIPPYASTSEATSPVKPQAAPRSASSGGLHADTESSPAGSWWGWTENIFQSDYSYGFDEVYANITVPPLPTTPKGSYTISINSRTRTRRHVRASCSLSWSTLQARLNNLGGLQPAST